MRRNGKSGQRRRLPSGPRGAGVRARPNPKRESWIQQHIVAIISVTITVILAAATALVGYTKTQTQNTALKEQVTALKDQVQVLQHDLDSVKQTNVKFIGLVTSLVEVGKASQIEVMKALGGEWPGAIPPKRVLKITRPPPESSQGAPSRVPAVITVRGTVHEPLSGRSIWIVTATPGINRYYPQGSWRPDRLGPASTTPDGRWTSPSVYLGDPKRDRGRHFDVIAILADQSAEDSLWEYLKEGSRTGSFPGIPELPGGAEEYDRVEIVRA
jgi:hypothetical protein